MHIDTGNVQLWEMRAGGLLVRASSQYNKVRASIDKWYGKGGHKGNALTTGLIVIESLKASAQPVFWLYPVTGLFRVEDKSVWVYANDDAFSF